MYMTLVYCGSLAYVRSRKPARPHRVSVSSPTSLHCSFSGSSLQAPSCERPCWTLPRMKLGTRLHGLVGPTLIFLVVVCRNCGRLPYRTTDRDRSSARTRHFLSSGVLDTRKNSTIRARDLCLRARVTVESQAPLKVSGLLRQASCGLRCRSAYVCDSLLYTPFVPSRDYRIRRAGHTASQKVSGLSSSFENLGIDL